MAHCSYVLRYESIYWFIFFSLEIFNFAIFYDILLQYFRTGLFLVETK